MGSSLDAIFLFGPCLNCYVYLKMVLQHRVIGLPFADILLVLSQTNLSKRENIFIIELHRKCNPFHKEHSDFYFKIGNFYIILVSLAYN